MRDINYRTKISPNFVELHSRNKTVNPLEISVVDWQIKKIQ